MHVVNLGFKPIPSLEINMGVRTLIAFVQPFSIISSPRSGEVAKVSDDDFVAVDKLEGSAKTEIDFVCFITYTRTVVEVTVDNQREEVAHFELSEIDGKFVVDKFLNVKKRLNVNLSLIIWHPLNLVVFHGVCVVGFSKLLSPLPTDLEHRRSGLETPGVVHVLENTQFITVFNNRSTSLTS